MGNKKCENRMKNILLLDRNFKSEALIWVIKSDLFDVFSNYFVLDDYRLDAKIEQTGGGFVLSCRLECEKIKCLNHIN